MTTRDQNVRPPSQLSYTKIVIWSLIFVFSFAVTISAQFNIDQKDLKRKAPPILRRSQTAQAAYLRLLQAQDQRAPASEIVDYLYFSHAGVRRYTLLSVGRIGDRAVTERIIDILETDEAPKMREYAAFALGELEDPKACFQLLSSLLNPQEPLEVKARCAEALGKIASIPENQKVLGTQATKRIIDVLINSLAKVSSETNNDQVPDQTLLTFMSINALMRIHPEAAIEPIAQQLLSSDAEIKFTATNALARILTSNPGKAPKTVITTASSLLKDSNPHTRAAAAKLLGAAKSRDSITDLTAVLADSDVQVQVSVIRALGAIGDKQAVSALIAYGQKLLDQYRKSVAENSKDKTIKQPTLSSELNQLLVLSSSFGLLKEPTSLGLLKQIRTIPTGRIGANQETEVAIAKFGEEAFFDYDKSVEIKSGDWQSISNFAVGLGELATEKGIKAIDEILFQDKFGKLDPRAIPTITQSAAKAKHPNLHKILLDELKADDVIVRATAAEMLGDSRKDEDFEALTSAFMKASADTMNDAKLAIVAAVAKFPKPETAEFLKGILKDPDYLVRRQASELLRFVTSGNQDNAVARVKTGHDSKFYAEVWALTERTKPVYAQLITSKGSLKIEMFTRDSPVTVYNFMQLAKKGFFNGISFHRVVPNFVVQAGDPRGDGNGGPGFQQRCEMNLKPYVRGTVGMALSGKDTGGSQFFICHSPQPHLDGTYTSFGQVVEGMDVVDKIVRGDTIERVVITE